jgi:hypothetical protein
MGDAREFADVMADAEQAEVFEDDLVDFVRAWAAEAGITLAPEQVQLLRVAAIRFNRPWIEIIR